MTKPPNGDLNCLSCAGLGLVRLGNRWISCPCTVKTRAGERPPEKIPARHTADLVHKAGRLRADAINSQTALRSVLAELEAERLRVGNTHLAAPVAQEIELVKEQLLIEGDE